MTGARQSAELTPPRSAHTDPDWVRRTGHFLRPDPARVVSTLFLPGQELAAPGRSRSVAVIDRVLALSEPEVDAELAALREAFDARHRDLAGTWQRHFDLVQHRLPDADLLSTARQQLIGAVFTQEYAIEGAALVNPSMVPHPDQSGLPAGTTRFILTLRSIGEGHRSSIELRTGTVDADDVVTLDPAPTVSVLPVPLEPTYSRAAASHLLRQDGEDNKDTEARSDADFVLDALPEEFSGTDLEQALALLAVQRLTRGETGRTAYRFLRITANSYTTRFPASSTVAERVLMPSAPCESNGMEDVRMVQFHEPDGGSVYLGTYTAFDGHAIATQLLRTSDFRTFTATPLSGPGAQNKGLALFPRQVGGRFLALSRADRENNSVTSSVDLLHWVHPVQIQAPTQPWEIVQLGNCGPPIETERGWLALTHGVGPMRRYSMGAILLDLDDPTVVIGRLDRPLLTPTEDERSGYVPNVVYSCGAMRHGGSLVLPYGCGDSYTRIAVVDLEVLLDSMTPTAR